MQVRRIRASGADSARHIKKYILPYLNSEEETHTIAITADGFNAGDRVKIHTYLEEHETHYVWASKNDEPQIRIRVSNLLKPIVTVNRGIQNEARLVERLQKHKLMIGQAAGCGSGNDFNIVDKRKVLDKQHDYVYIQGEHKMDVKSCTFGQMTLTSNVQSGTWFISDNARLNRPEYAKQIEAATITYKGNTAPVMARYNDVWHWQENTYTDKTDFKPAHAYLKDHNVDILHIDSHGTYLAGKSEEEDRHNLELPVINGTGKFSIRQKQIANPNSRTVEFKPSSVAKSSFHIGHDDDLNLLKKKLGHA